MNWPKQLDILKIVLGVKFFNKKIPLAVRWGLTDRCILKCKYCGIWKSELKELPTKRILELLDEMKRCGTKKISFSGGEPLLRDDIGEIISHCKKIGISPEMNSTGFLLPEKIKELKDVDLIKLSFDGPGEIHEQVRGNKDSYQWLVNAASCAKANNLRFIFTTTLTKYNINYTEDILHMAKKFNTFVAFQPLKDISYPHIETDDVKSISPSPEAFKKAIDKLISYKKQRKFLMRNSVLGLKHIYHWPQFGKLKCWGGKIFCMIAPNGEVSPCDRIKYDKLPNCNEIGFKEAFNRLPPLPICEGCGFCGTLELNYLMSFRFNILKSLIRIMG